MAIAVATILAVLIAGCDDSANDAGATAAFTHGVASGSVTRDSVVLWTRAVGGDRVIAEVAADPSFATIAATAEGRTSAQTDFTVRVKVDGLAPATRYAYRFRAGAAVSATGVFLTAPAADDAARVRFAFSGDSDGTRNADGTPRFNNFEALHAVAKAAPDFFLYIGDTIYGDRPPEAFSVEEYRAKYRQNREYPALTSLLAATSTYAIWDDHEVVNDFAAETVDPARFEAGRQAFQEYVPLAEQPTPIMYRAFRWGAALDVIVLDTRSFRSASAAEACANDPLPGGALPDAPEPLRAIRTFAGLPAELPAGCPAALNDPARTMLGAAQLAFLLERLRSSQATWKVVVTSVPMQSLLVLPYDRWEGYPAERRQILDAIRDEAIENVVFVTADLHGNVLGPVRLDPFAALRPVAYEAIAGPIATTPLRQDIVEVVGESAAGLLDDLLISVAGAECADLNAFAFGWVEVDPVAGTMTVSLRNDSGAELCQTVLRAR